MQLPKISRCDINQDIYIFICSPYPDLDGMCMDGVSAADATRHAGKLAGFDDIKDLVARLHQSHGFLAQGNIFNPVLHYPRRLGLADSMLGASSSSCNSASVTVMIMLIRSC